MPGLPLTTTLHIPLSRTASGTPGENLPDVAITMAHLIQSLKLAYKTFQKGEFSRVQAIFSTIFKSIPLVITETRSASHEVRSPFRMVV